MHAGRRGGRAGEAQRRYRQEAREAAADEVALYDRALWPGEVASLAADEQPLAGR
jgi:hypothetical protein